MNKKGLQMMDMLKVLLFVQAFYAFGITMIAYSIPPEALGYTTSVNGPSGFDITTINGKLTTQLDSQKNTPLLDLGALLFYSGNMVIDLLLNFVTAIPQMILLLFQIIFGRFIGIDATLLANVEIFTGGIIAAIYVVNLIILLLNIRSRGGTIV